jgi:signal transduction histidine kinase
VINRNTLFFQLLANYFLLAIGILLAFVFSFKFLGHNRQQKAIHQNIENYIQYIVEDLPSPITIEKLKQLEDKLNIGIIYNHLKSDPSLPDLSDLGEGINIRPNISFAHKKGQRYILYNRDGNRFAFAMYLGPRDGFPTLALFSAILFSLTIFFLIFMNIRRIFRPLEVIRKNAELFAKGEFESSTQVHGKGQLAHLAKSIEKMGKQIQAMLETKRELLLAIAHELKTPLTRAKLHTELLEDPRKQDIHYNLSELDQLLSQILESERLELDHRAVKKENLDMDQLIQNILLDNPEYTPIHYQSCGPTIIPFDQNRYRVVITNLLSNALNHGHGDITLELTKKALTISNQSEKLTNEDRVKILTPFYRVDKGRGRDENQKGHGLGLYLVSQILKAHGHSLRVNWSHGKIYFTILF